MLFSFEAILPVALGLAAAGCAAGLIAGLLGVGGGIIIVPVLYQILTMLDIPDTVIMHLAVGTSLACIVITSLSSVRSHWRRDAVDWSLVRSWGPGIVVGCVLGTMLASFVKGDVLTGLFGALALVVATYMTLSPEGTRITDRLPSGLRASSIAAAIGGLSVMVGIGGGTLTVPILSLCSYPIRRAVGTAAAFGFIIAAPGTIGFALAGWGLPDLPPLSVGYVSLLGVALITPLSVLMAPVGARLAHAIRPNHLRKVFALFLAITSVRMFYALSH